jgi:hypothetical protein
MQRRCMRERARIGARITKERDEVSAFSDRTPMQLSNKMRA